MIIIILVVQEINFIYRNSGEWRLGGRGKVVSGSTDFFTISRCIIEIAGGHVLQYMQYEWTCIIEILL